MTIEGEFQPNPEREAAFERLRFLAERYRTLPFLLDGVDEDAKQSNARVIDAIQSAGRTIAKESDNLFGIHLKGSRIKGYHTRDSDVDIVLATPSLPEEEQLRYWGLVRGEIASRSASSGVDPLPAVWQQEDIPTNAEEFMYWVDHHGDELVTLFGYTPYETPNLNLAKLSALEIIRTYKQPEYDWEAIQVEYAKDYVGDRSHIIGKLSERYGIDTSEVSQLFTPSLFDERNKQFGLPPVDQLYEQLKNWYGRFKGGASKHRMFSTYRGVRERLKAGY